MSAMATEPGTLVQQAPARPAAAPEDAPPTAAPDGGAAAATGKAAKKQKDSERKGKKGKASGAESAKGAADAQGTPSVAAHPRAARSVARTKGWGGLAGFFIAGYMSLPTGTLAQAGLRALVAGAICYVAAWAGAVFVWRRLVVLEIKGREQQLLAGATAPSGGEASAAPVERSGARLA
jgi:hypothetical protein